MNPRRLAALLALFASLLAACEGPASASPPDASAPPPSASAAPPAAPAPTAPAPKPQLHLLKFAFTSEVKNKEPADKLEAAAAGDRVYVHLTVRNRDKVARKITVVFSVNKSERSKVELNVEPSWSFRTWAYGTLRAGDTTGLVEVELRDEDGGTIHTATLPIKAASIKKPLSSRP